MTVFRHDTKYQGFPCSGVAFTRSSGLRPETGNYVDISLTELQQIRVFPKPVPWVPVNGFEMPGQLSVGQVLAVGFPSVQEGKVPTQSPGAGGGLDEFGTLQLRSFEDGQLTDDVRFANIYVHHSGIQEIEPAGTHKRAKAHASGVVRVPLSDIRMYYDRSAFVGRVNVKMPTGFWDTTSLKDGKRPYTLREVLAALFALLPGTPAVLDTKDVASDATPIDLIGDGSSPVARVIEALLERYGLQAQMSPLGNYFVTKLARGKPSAGKIIIDTNGGEGFYERQHAETKSVVLTRRPELVQVFGLPPVRRITLAYVPVIEDLDGLIFPLRAVEEHWGYPLEKLNRQVFNQERPFADVPPSPADDIKLHERRRRALIRSAYKMYAPAFYFEGDTARRAVALSKMKRHPLLPLKDFGIRKSELESLSEGPPEDAGRKAEPHAVLPPIVFAKRVGEGRFENFSVVESYFEQLLASVSGPGSLSGALTRVAQVLRSAASSDGQLAALEAASAAQSGDGASELAGAAASLENIRKVFADRVVGLAAGLTQHSDLADVAGTARTLKTSVGRFTAQLRKARTTDSFQALRDEHIELLRVTNELRAQVDEVAAQWQQKFADLRDAYEQQGSVFLLHNLPWGRLEEGSYRLDKSTGLMESAEPLAWGDLPFVPSRDRMWVESDGSVVVTAGYELKLDGAEGLTNVLIAATAGGPAIAGRNRASSTKALGLRDPKMRLYVSELGNPINPGEVDGRAMERGGRKVGSSQVGTGFTYTFTGFKVAILRNDVSSVQYKWDGRSTAAAQTMVMVNAPMARGLVNVPGLANRGSMATWDRLSELHDHDTEDE